MANEQITLMARARKLGVDGYRRMSTDELRDAIKRAETGSTAKGKSSVPAKGKTATPAKGKTSTNGRTTAKGKSAPAKGKSSPAKKTSTAAPAKSTTRKPATPKGKTTAAKGAQAKRSPAARTRKAISAGTRAALGKINWNKPSNVGTTGKRKDVLDALRENKGDKAAAFKALKRKATRYYPEKDKDEAERMLVWLIGRVAFDYAFKTGQHEPAERAAYGSSTRPADVKRREARAAAHRPKRSRTAKASTRKAAPAKGKGKTAARKGR